MNMIRESTELEKSRLTFGIAVIRHFSEKMRSVLLCFSVWPDWMSTILSHNDVALVRIQNACLKCAARGSLKVQDAKNRHLDAIAQLCPAISSTI